MITILAGAWPSMARIASAIWPSSKRRSIAGVDLPGLDQVAQDNEVVAPWLRDEEHRLSRAELRGQRDPDHVAERPEQELSRPADENHHPVRRERASHREPGPAAGVVEHEVVAGAAAGEVLAAVVEDPVGAQTARLVDVAAAADRVHRRPERLGDLDGDVPTPPGAPWTSGPGCTPPWSRRACSAVRAASGTARGLLERERPASTSSSVGSRRRSPLDVEVR